MNFSSSVLLCGCNGGGLTHPPPSIMTGTCPVWTGVMPMGKSLAPYSMFHLKKEGGEERGRRKLMRAGGTLSYRGVVL